MKKIFMTMAAMSALAVGAPAFAQGNSQYANGNVQARVQQLQVQLQTGIQSGAISRQEASPLRDQLRQLVRMERIYARDGISGRERAELQQRINGLRQQMRFAARNGDNRYGNDRYGQNGQYPNGQYDRDDRYDRDDDDRYDRDDRYGNDDRYQGSLRIGQRVSANLGGLPSELRDRFRDGGGYYYRYGNGNVYQVDARTQTIVRVYDARR